MTTGGFQAADSSVRLRPHIRNPGAISVREPGPGESMARSKNKQKRVRQLRKQAHKRRMKRRKAEKKQEEQS